MSKQFCILVADDSRAMREIVHRYLKPLEDQIIFKAAPDGLEAERIIQEGNVFDEKVSLVILDWMMPNQSGYELLQKIREVSGNPTEPKVIMLTAETYPDQIEACLKYNVSAYITKPFTQDELLTQVCKVLDIEKPEYTSVEEELDDAV